MEPSFVEGQVLDVQEVSQAEIARGDVIVFEYEGRTLLKRVVALPGETIEINGASLIVDGVILQEEYTLYPGHYSILPITLADGEYFVLGDNRDHSADSANFGPIPADAILGRVVQ